MSLEQHYVVVRIPRDELRMFEHVEKLSLEVILIVEIGILRKGMVHRNRGSLVGSLEVCVGVCGYVVSLIRKELLLSM